MRRKRIANPFPRPFRYIKSASNQATCKEAPCGVFQNRSHPIAGTLLSHSGGQAEPRRTLPRIGRTPKTHSRRRAARNHPQTRQAQTLPLPDARSRSPLRHALARPSAASPPVATPPPSSAGGPGALRATRPRRIRRAPLSAFLPGEPAPKRIPACRSGSLAAAAQSHARASTMTTTTASRAEDAGVRCVRAVAYRALRRPSRRVWGAEEAEMGVCGSGSGAGGLCEGPRWMRFSRAC